MHDFSALCQHSSTTTLSQKALAQHKTLSGDPKCTVAVTFSSNCLSQLPSFSSKCGHVTEKHVLIGCKHDMFGSQTFEV